MTKPDLLEQTDKERPQFIKLLRSLVELESPSTHKELVDQLGSFVIEHLLRNGLSPQRVSRPDAGDLIWSQWGEKQAGQILVLCHLDTVWEPGSLKGNPFRVENQRIYGPGILDMKAGVAATLKIQEYLAQGWLEPRKKVRFLYTTDEEICSRASRDVIEEFARQSDVVLVTEPPLPGGVLKTFRKGIADFSIKIHGKLAHAGLDPENGINAVEEMAHQILRIHSFAAPEKGTTVAVTVVRGGVRPNVIPEYAEAMVDARFRSMREGEGLQRSIYRLKPHLRGARLELSGKIDRPPMVRTERTRQLFAAASQIARTLGIELREGDAGGGSDGNFTAALGVATLDGLGIPGNGAHTWQEYIDLEALVPRTVLLARLIELL